MTLWLAAAALTAGIVCLLLWQRRGTSQDSNSSYDLAVYRDQLSELDRDAERGLIDARQADAARTEISRRMLAASSRVEGKHNSRYLVWVFVATIALLAALALGLLLGFLGPESSVLMPLVALGLIAALCAISMFVPDRRHRARVLVLVLCGWLPLAAVVLYLPIGNPDLPSQPYAGRDRSGQEAVMAAVREADALAQALADNPDNPAGWVELGQRYRELGRLDEAVAAFARAIGLTGGDPTITSFYGETLVEFANGMVTEDAVHAFESVLERLPGEPRAHYYLGLARAQAGDDAGALERWQSLAAASPADAPWLPTVREQIRRTAERMGLDPESQVPDPLPAMAGPRVPQGPAGAPGPDAADIAAAQSMSPQEQAEMIRGMVEGLASRLEDTPDDLAGWLRLGGAYRVLGEPENAAAALSRAAALAPDDPEVLGAYADALLDTAAGQTLAPEFISVMERLLELDRNDVRALWFLGARAMAENRPREAEDLWGRLLDQLEPGTEAYQTVREFLSGVEPEEP